MIHKFIETKSNSELLCRTILGLERETIRTKEDGTLSRKMHPETLGRAYTHPLIKTDFCEAQVEYSTKSSYRLETVLRSLENLHNYTVKNIDSEEFLWPFSMPPRLPEDESEIPLAIYGDSYEAIKKTVYRRGLGYRYGRRMQTISGVHINISFSRYLINWASQNRFNKDFNQDTQTQLYLDTIRNFNRYSFLLVYLFGASPTMDKSFSKPIPGLKDWMSNTRIAENSTSLRLSELGYTSQVQNRLVIGFNRIEDYLKDMKRAISEVFPPYTKYNNQKSIHPSLDEFKTWNQLNDFCLQIENEYYSLIRPKQVPNENERPIESMENRGIRYLEIRCVDSDPFSSIGITEESIAFNQLFLLYCLLRESPPMDEREKQDWDENQDEVVWNGRNPTSKYKVFGEKKSLKEWFYAIYPELEKIALFWDDRESCNVRKSTQYINSLLKQKEKIDNIHLTPSNKIVEILKNEKKEFMDIGKELGKKYRESWLNQDLDIKVANKLNSMRKESMNG